LVRSLRGGGAIVWGAGGVVVADSPAPLPLRAEAQREAEVGRRKTDQVGFPASVQLEMGLHSKSKTKCIQIAHKICVSMNCI
jgi:hypothetical protein